MTQYNDVDSALNDIPGATSLWIDFSKGQHLTESIGDLSELTTLNLRVALIIQ
jgi:hypothetical protein